MRRRSSEPMSMHNKDHSTAEPAPRKEKPASSNQETVESIKATAIPPILHRRRRPRTSVVQPTSSHVGPLLTDLYEITMACSLWESGRADVRSVFELYFRKNPFKGSYLVVAGVDECLRLLSTFKFTPDDIAYVRTLLPSAPAGFFDWLAQIDCSRMCVHAQVDGSIAFPTVPLLSIQGPLAVVQLLETALLNCMNYACLVTTNASRYRLAAGPRATLLEFGLRRAQGPDGAVSAAKYCYLGGFDGTSNMLAGRLFGVPVRGTHAHSFVQSFSSLAELKAAAHTVRSNAASIFTESLAKRALELRNLLAGPHGTSEGELAAFVAYAGVFPNSFLALVDTYDALQSGVPNFMAVAIALAERGHFARGVRIDSGNLGQLSVRVREVLRKLSAIYFERDERPDSRVKGIGDRVRIIASNDVSVELLLELGASPHEINGFGVGTHLVTCKGQPALGGVYKQVEIGDRVTMKRSEDLHKASRPAQKRAYRVIGLDRKASADILLCADESPPEPGHPFACRHVLGDSKMVTIVGMEIRPLMHEVWNSKEYLDVLPVREYLDEARAHFEKEKSLFGSEYFDLTKQIEYPVLLSCKLFELMQRTWSESGRFERPD